MNLSTGYPRSCCTARSSPEAAVLTPYCLLTTENGAGGGEGHVLARPSTSCVVRRREGELRPPRPTPRFPFPPSVPPFMHRRSDRRCSFAQPARAPPPAWPPCAGCTHRLSRACSGTCGAVLPMAGRETETARPVCSGVDEAGQGRVGNARSGNEPCRTGRRAAANTRRCPPLPAVRSAGAPLPRAAAAPAAAGPVWSTARARAAVPHRPGGGDSGDGRCAAIDSRTKRTHTPRGARSPTRAAAGGIGRRRTAGRRVWPHTVFLAQLVIRPSQRLPTGVKKLPGHPKSREWHAGGGCWWQTG